MHALIKKSKQRSYDLRKKDKMYKKKIDVSFFGNEDALNA